MLKKKTIAKITISLAAIIAIALTLTLKSADFADTAFRKALNSHQIETSNFPPPEKRIGALRYKNVPLSEEGETSLDTLTITFNPFQWKKVTSVTIDGLYLSGDLDINGTLSIKGLPALTKLTAPKTLDRLSLKNINFSILSAHFGGIRGTANISANNNEQAFVWTGNVESRQEQLDLIAKFSGQANHSGRWFNDFEIENAKLERNYGKFTRVYGTATWNGQNENWKQFEADLNAGGLNINGTAWKNASITIQSKPHFTKSTIAAKSAGIEEIELGIDALYKEKSLKWNASIHAPTAMQLINYLSAQDYIPMSIDAFSEFKNKKDLTLRIGTKKESLIFNLKNQSKEIDIKGKITEEESNNFQLVAISEKNFKDGIKGTNCTSLNKEKPCALNILFKDGKYSLTE